MKEASPMVPIPSVYSIQAGYDITAPVELVVIDAGSLRKDEISAKRAEIQCDTAERARTGIMARG
jgi:hypothetical protein